MVQSEWDFSTFSNGNIKVSDMDLEEWSSSYHYPFVSSNWKVWFQIVMDS
jgi:hypothetical protein